MARTKQTARHSSTRSQHIERARRGGIKKVNSGFCHPPKKGVVMTFSFKVTASSEDTDYYYSDAETSDDEEMKYSVGDDDIVFTVVVSVTEAELSVELISASQKHSVVHLIQCAAVADLNSMNDFYSGDSMEPLVFEPMTFNSQKKSVRVSQTWPGYEEFGRPNWRQYCCYDDDEDISHPTISISGSVMYEEPPLKMQKEISTLFNNDENNDVEICVGDDKKKFAAHKCILSARSSFFQAMFSSNMRESIENIVSLPEDSPEVFHQVLHYIYTDSCPKMSQMTTDLLLFADKYDVKGLLELCEDEIKNTMNSENVCDYLVKSGMINTKGIYDQCYRFIRKNKAIVAKTDGWGKLKEISEEQAHSHKFLEDVIKEMEK